MTRLGDAYGTAIDRSKPISFRFEGKSYDGFAGDTIASALAANGVWLLSRSFKYHRPRGPLTMAGQDANTLVQIGDEASVLADRQPIHDGLEARGQNYLGSLTRDRGRIVESVARFLPVGFYYKAFFRPQGAWRHWEKLIRRAAGLGRVNPSGSARYYDKAHGFADVAVVGGGPAGMRAALEAARAGAEVVLIDENAALGGSLGYARFDVDGGRAGKEGAELSHAITAERNIRVMTSTTANGWFADNWLPLIHGNRMTKLRATAVVAATGSIEQPMVFRNNDLPGIVMGSAAQRLIRLYGVKPGKRALVVTANSDGYGVALDLDDVGVELSGVLDLRPEPPECPLRAEVRRRLIRIGDGLTVCEAGTRPDRNHLAGVKLAAIVGRGEWAETKEVIRCDLLCLSVGYAPTAQLLLHAGARAGFDVAAETFRIEDLPAHLFVAGSVNGCYELDAVLADGRRAGAAAAADAGFDTELPPAPEPAASPAVCFDFPIFRHRKGKDFVDFDEDLTVADLRNGVADGFEHIELLKRYSTVGMGPSQGRTAALNTARLVAAETGRPMAEIGVTTARPPFAAEKFGHLAGRGFHPVRHTAMHWRHVDAGAQMMVAGAWLRPAWYGGRQDGPACIDREVANVRENVGLIDVSTLGGLDVRGPDAAEFLNRIYTFGYLRQPVGRARYVLMTDQTGVVVDDGVACRLHDRHFYVTATTGGVDGVYRQMLWHNAQWRLDVDVANVTGAYAGVNIAGPNARRVLQTVCDDVDLSADAFPYMGVRQGVVAGLPARILRVGFVGELGYEIHVGASLGEALWDAVLAAGSGFGIAPFGVEAQRVLRLEKGHIIVGQDTDGLTTPPEAAMAWAISRRKPYFVGKRAIEIQEAKGLTRSLVGFTLDDAAGPLPSECHLVIRDGDIAGRVTSIARSNTLGRVIGLAYVAPDQTEIGSRFQIKGPGGRMVEAEVVPLPFYDPDNNRQAL